MYQRRMANPTKHEDRCVTQAINAQNHQYVKAKPFPDSPTRLSPEPATFCARDTNRHIKSKPHTRQASSKR